MQVCDADLHRLLQLEPFQEWPQLLDPHLSGLLQPLVSAFIAYLSEHANDYHQVGEGRPGIIPLPRAICKILYVFCKVRGAKVITQFLNNEPKQLKPMLEALESWSEGACASEEMATPKYGYMVWEEGFIMLLWLSHLLLVPFGLSSMSSDDSGTQLRHPLYIDLPSTVPPIAKRLVRVSTSHLSLPSKAREAAATLLVRLAKRTDMRRISLQNALIHWALSYIRGDPESEAPMLIYGLIGILSFLAGFIASVETEIIEPFLSHMYNSIQHAKSSQSPAFVEAISSVPARKLIIKVERALAVAGLRIDSKSVKNSGPSIGEGALEDIINDLLTALECKDTPVRLAASKGLSVIALELDSDMVEQIVDMIDERLYEDTLWKEAHTRGDIPGSFELELGAANALRWHGLILTLSQLIFRGSMPKSVLGRVISTLTVALRFEQRSSLGNSTGTSVRDAACFGLWAFSRRFSTIDIKNCKPFRRANQDHAIAGLNSPEDLGSTHQILANELILAATLDPAGNIRRGASAALQEIIGRHPDEIKHGIGLVQIVDYHAIALKSRAMTEVAVNVSRIEPIYWHSILRGLLGWRGVRSGDVDCRRNAAHAIGLLAHSRSPETVASIISMLRHRLQDCEIRNIEERHGLIIALSEVVSRFSDVDPNSKTQLLVTTESELAQLWQISDISGWSSRQPDKGLVATNAKYLRSALICEVICLLIAALASFATHEYSIRGSPTEIDACIEVLEISLRQSDEIVLAASAKAAKSLFPILDRAAQDKLVSGWVQLLSDPRSRSRVGSLVGVVTAIGAVFEHIRTLQMQTLVVDTLVNLVSSENSVEIRCAAIRSLRSGVLESNGTRSFRRFSGRGGAG